MKRKCFLIVLILVMAMLLVGCTGAGTVTPVTEENDTYSLRDIGPAGGYIFYDKGSYSGGWRYLEAAPVSTEWPYLEWGHYGTLMGGTEKGIGTGQSNTTKIVAWLNSYSETDCAAQLCDALVYGGYSDWFLPSKDELNLMYTNLKVFGVGVFGGSYYWSSSEANAYFACGYSTSVLPASTASPRASTLMSVRCGLFNYLGSGGLCFTSSQNVKRKQEENVKS